jgi:hypothetical protein
MDKITKFILFTVISITLWTGCNSSTNTNKQFIGKTITIPDSLEIYNYKPANTDFSVAMIYYFDGSCSSCIYELYNDWLFFTELTEDYPQLKIVFVSATQDATVTLKSLNEVNFPFTVYIDAMDRFKSTNKVLFNSSSLILDHENKIQAVFYNFDKNYKDDLRNYLDDQFLEEKEE